MEKIERSLLRYEHQRKTNELVGSQYRNDPCENEWMQSYCVISYADFHYGGLAALYAEDLTHTSGFYYVHALKRLEEYYFTLV